MNPNPAAAGEPFAGLFAESWWEPALAPHERQLATAAVRPGWVDGVERAALAAATSDSDGIPTEFAAAFALVLRPFTVEARAQVLAAVPGRYADPGRIAEQFSAVLGQRLVGLAARTLVLELHRRRVAGDLSGADPALRFADFVRWSTGPEALARLAAAYPVLARLAAEKCAAAAAAHVELLSRFAADRAAIVATLLDGVDPGRLLAVAAGLGDAHRGGRTVAVLTFADGRRVVYKPRSLDAQALLHTLVTLLGESVAGLGLRTAALVVRPGYGWMQFVAAEPLPDESGAGRFYRRLGALLALLHVVRATDLHYANVIAWGEQPALIDVETIFQPAAYRPGDDPAARALADSVTATGLLPSMVVGAHGVLDVSGLGGDSNSAAPVDVVDWEAPGTDEMRLSHRQVQFASALNRPRIAGRVVEPCDHTTDLLDGFRCGYDALVQHRAEFAEAISAAAGCPIRVVVRPTQLYASLLDESAHPDVLRDAADRDEFLREQLAEAATDPIAHRLVEHEIRDLWAGDVPCFTGLAGARHLWTSRGVRIADALRTDGMAVALDVLHGLAGPDRADQEWIVAATLATRTPVAGGHGAARLAPAAAGSPGRNRRDGPAEPEGCAAEPDPDRLLTAACAIGDHLLARSMTDRRRLNWLGLELVDDLQWLVLPMGASLGTGYSGVALYLAELAELTGVSRYRVAAEAAMRAVTQLHEQLSGHPEWIAAVGCGGYAGFAGIGYALARLSVLFGADEWRQHSEAMIDLAGVAVEQPGPPGVAKGTAGCLAAMLAVHHELGLGGAARLAGVCADLLVDLVEGTDGWCTPTAVGAGAPLSFADGAAGIGWALAQAGASNRDPRRAGAAESALRRAGTALSAPAEAGWSAGLAGLLAAEAGGSGREAVDRQVAALADRDVGADLSLASGELGVVEALLSAAVHSPLALRAARRRAASIVQAVDHDDFACGVPHGVHTPGLLTGTAGIGYGLLRLAFPHRVPSVLLLQPNTYIAPTHQ